MKSNSKIKILIICSLLFLGACQTEEFEVISGDDDGVAQQDAEFYNLVQRSAMHDGSEDDQIDESPCFSIRFPYEIVIDGVEIKITSGTDMDAVLSQLDEVNLSSLRLKFPVTLIMSNYQNVTVRNWQQYVGLQQGCRNDIASNEDPIICVAPEFPVRVFIYNLSTQKTSSANFANKQQLFDFMNNRAPDEVLDFDYPMTLVNADNSKLEIATSAQFKNALKDCIN